MRRCPCASGGRCAICCAAVPASVSALAPMSAVAKSGVAARLCPAASITWPRPTQPNSLPPCASGTRKPAQPSSTICRHRGSEKPNASLSSRSLRSAATGERLAKKSSAVARTRASSGLSTSAIAASIRQAKHALGDDVELDLGGAAFDRIRLGAQPFPCRPQLLRCEAVAFPAQGLRAEAGEQQLEFPLVELGAVELEHGGGGTRCAAGLGLLGGAALRQEEGALIHFMRGDAVAQHGIGDAAVALADITLGESCERPVGAPLALADRGDHLALMLQEALRDRPALIEPADEIAQRHADILEEGLAERRGAADQPDRPRAHAGIGHVDEDEADALVLFCERVGAHQAEDPIRLVGVGGPDLVAVDQEMLALRHRARLQAGEVGARLGLAIALAPADLAARDPRQMRALLLLAAGFEQHRAQHPDAEALQRRPAIEPPHLFLEDARFAGNETAAAILLGPARHGPAARRHALQPELRLRVLEPGITPAPDDLVLGHRRAHRRRTI